MMQHPQVHFIQAFAKGDLPSPVATMVSAHLEICEDCQSSYREMIRLESKVLENEIYNLGKSELDKAFESVMGKIDSEMSKAPENLSNENIKIEISGQVIELPRAMNFLKDQKIAWKEFGKKNAIAPVSVGARGNFYLIYIGPGESVPHHDHSGLEYSYVAAGSYDDGISNFNTGDFSVSSSGYTHSPRATSADGCLVISWVEGRLNYFGGILKPLNSLLWWYLHRA